MGKKSKDPPQPKKGVASVFGTCDKHMQGITEQSAKKKCIKIFNKPCKYWRKQPC